MNTTSLLVKLNQQGVKLSVKNKQLIVYSKDNLSPEIMQILAKYKDLLILKLHEINNTVAIALSTGQKILRDKKTR